MPFDIVSASRLLLLGSLAAFVSAQDDNPCKSYGVDFQTNGTYFQNILSTDPFTFVEYFKGCQSDTAQNILVDPTGNQVQCSDTNLTPAGVNMLSTCPLLKNQLFSGEWSVIVLSNNGAPPNEPIAYQRDFSLIVGTQSTLTLTPTVTNLITSTPIITGTKTITDFSTTTAPVKTVTSPSVTSTPTITITPAVKKVTTTHPVFVLTMTSIVKLPQVTTVTQTAECTIPAKGLVDFWANIFPTIPGVTAKAMAKPTPALKAPGHRLRFARGEDIAYPIDDKAAFLRKRSEGLAHLAKRAPDAMTVTVNATATSLFKTITSTVLAPAITSLVNNTVTATTTLTLPPVVVVKGAATGVAVTVTAPTPIVTVTVYPLWGTAWVTKTIGAVITVTDRITPSGALASCTKAGGKMW